MADDFFCSECGYASNTAGNCPYCSVPMVNLNDDDVENEGKKKTYPKDLVEKYSDDYLKDDFEDQAI